MLCSLSGTFGWYAVPGPLQVTPGRPGPGLKMIFVGSAACFLPLKKGLLPEGNPNYVYIDIEGPPGATLRDMRMVVSRLDALLARQPETAAVFADVGGQSVSSGYVVEVLKPHRRASVRDLRDRLRPLLRQHARWPPKQHRTFRLQS